MKKAELLQEFCALSAREEHFRTIVESVPVMLWMTDVNGKSQFFSQKWKAFTGLPSQDPEFSAWLELLHPEDRQQCLHSFRKAFEAQLPFEMEYRLRRYDGEYRWILDVGEPRRNADGRFAGFVGSSQDITERKRAEEALRLSYAELERHHRENKLLAEMSGCLQVCRSVAELYPVIRHYGKRMFPGKSGILCLIKESRSLVEAVVEWGQVRGCETVFNVDDCWCLRQGRPHRVIDPQDGLYCSHIKKASVKACLCMPLNAYGETLGFLHVQIQTDGEEDLGKEESIAAIENLASSFVDNVALALANLKLRDALQRQSVRDPLTQLFNRRYLVESLERELARANRSQATVGVAMIDVDHFKRFNDTFGHDAGDAVLREFGTFLKNFARREDILCRYGGEGFVVVMAGIDEEKLMFRCEEMRRKIKLLTVEHRGQRLGTIAISIGAAMFPRHGENLEAVLNAADAALYRAKRAGRDQIMVAESAPPTDEATASDRPVEEPLSAAG
ncbi:MAG: diguanylate cyclase [Pseudomonadota bacterium]